MVSFSFGGGTAQFVPHCSYFRSTRNGHTLYYYLLNVDLTSVSFERGRSCCSITFRQYILLRAISRTSFSPDENYRSHTLCSFRFRFSSILRNGDHLLAHFFPGQSNTWTRNQAISTVHCSSLTKDIKANEALIHWLGAYAAHESTELNEVMSTTIETPSG